MGIQNEIIKYKPISPSTYLLALIVITLLHYRLNQKQT